jgi:type II secretory pathway pseudopilin PulG
MTLLEIGLLVCLVISAIALAIALFTFKRLRQQALDTEKLIQRLTREVAASSSGSVGMGQRLLAMEKRLQTSGDKKPEKIDYYNDDEFQPYSQAAQMFKMGMDAEEVARRCGLSRAEASLLEMMQKSSR